MLVLQLIYSTCIKLKDVGRFAESETEFRPNLSFSGQHGHTL